MMIEYGCLNAGMFLFTSSVKVEHGRVTSTKSHIDALVFKIALTNNIFSLSSVYTVILFFLRFFPSATTFKSNLIPLKSTFCLIVILSSTFFR